MAGRNDSMRGTGTPFAVLWAVAVLFHLLGAGDIWGLGDGADRISGALLGLAAIWVLLRPGSPVRFVALVALQFVDVVVDAPLLGSHWILGGFVALTLLTGAVALYLRNGGIADLDELTGLVAPALRLEVLTFYFFVAFAKLNTGFIDTGTSCAVEFWGSLVQDTGSWLHAPATLWLVVWGTVAIEIALPILLLVRRTRLWGVGLGLGFHFVLALDPFQHVADFSSTMYALLLAFFAPQVLRSIGADSRVRVSPIPRAAVIGVTGGLALATAANDGFNRSAVLILSRQVLWWGYAIVMIWMATTHRTAPPDQGRTRRVAPLLLIPMALLLVNGIAPYVGLKNGSAFNMYSNLEVSGDSSNHLLVPSAPLGPTDDELIVIIDASDPELIAYSEGRFALTVFELRDFADERPDTSLVYERAGTVTSIDHLGDSVQFGTPLRWWERKLLLFRPFALDDPAPCLRGWGPAM